MNERTELLNPEDWGMVIKSKPHSSFWEKVALVIIGMAIMVIILDRVAIMPLLSLY